jgi:hypothetical protein
MPTNIPGRAVVRPPSRVASAIFLALPLGALAIALICNAQLNALVTAPPF